MLGTSCSEKRLVILEWLRDPASHFPPQPHGDPVEDGVTTDAVAARLGVTRAVAASHLDLLVDMGLLQTRRIRWRTYYRRDEMRIAEVARMFEKGW